MIKVANDTIANPDNTGGCWPTRHQELLLTAALAAPDAAHRAWLDWNRDIDLIDDTIDLGSYRLLPLVYTNIQPLDNDLPHIGRLKGLHRRAWVETQLHLRAGANILEVISKTLSQKDANRTKLNETKIIAQISFMPDQDATVVLQPGKEPFHFPTPFVTAQLAPILGFGFLAVGAMRRNHLNLTLGM